MPDGGNDQTPPRRGRRQFFIEQDEAPRPRRQPQQARGPPFGRNPDGTARPNPFYSEADPYVPPPRRVAQPQMSPTSPFSSGRSQQFSTPGTPGTPSAPGTGLFGSPLRAVPRRLDLRPADPRVARRHGFFIEEDLAQQEEAAAAAAPPRPVQQPTQPRLNPFSMEGMAQELERMRARQAALGLSRVPQRPARSPSTASQAQVPQAPVHVPAPGPPPVWQPSVSEPPFTPFFIEEDVYRDEMGAYGPHPEPPQPTLHPLSIQGMEMERNRIRRINDARRARLGENPRLTHATEPVRIGRPDHSDFQVQEVLENRNKIERMGLHQYLAHTNHLMADVWFIVQMVRDPEQLPETHRMATRLRPLVRDLDQLTRSSSTPAVRERHPILAWNLADRLDFVSRNPLYEQNWVTRAAAGRLRVIAQNLRWFTITLRAIPGNLVCTDFASSSRREALDGQAGPVTMRLDLLRGYAHFGTEIDDQLNPFLLFQHRTRPLMDHLHQYFENNDRTWRVNNVMTRSSAVAQAMDRNIGLALQDLLNGFPFDQQAFREHVEAAQKHWAIIKAHARTTFPGSDALPRDQFPFNMQPYDDILRDLRGLGGGIVVADDEADHHAAEFLRPK